MEHNFYFDGKMQSLGFQSDKGEATVGVIEPGSYKVATDCVEQITVLSGRARVKVTDQDWKDIKTGDTLSLPPNVEVAWEISPPNVCYSCLFPE
jgi:purine/pyrimidine-nucleoside phosphorylase